MKKSFVALVLFVVGAMANVVVAQSQPSADMGKHIKKEVQYAILLMDNGMVKQSIHFLDSMNVVHPDNFLVMFELGYAHLLDKNYEKSLNIYKYMCDNLPDADAQAYQMLGNLYDYNGNREKAIEAYKKGIEKFPNSGMIYCELGIMSLHENDFNTALGYFETGIMVEPTYSPNYYRASQLLMDSNQKSWGMIYAETMANLPSREGRKAEVIKIMTDVINEKITYKNDSIRVSFNEVNVVDTYADVVATLYEMGFFKAATIKKQGDKFSIKDLIELRSGLFELVPTLKEDVYLFDFFARLKEAGHWEAYNYWLFYEVNKEEADAWLSENYDKLEALSAWLDDNPFELTDKNSVSRRKLLYGANDKQK